MTNNEYKELFDSACVGLWRSDSNGKIIAANTEVASILGFNDATDLLNHKIVDENIKNVQDLEVCMKKKDGTDIWVSLSTKTCPEKGFIEGYIKDISEKKEQESQIFPYIEKLSEIKQKCLERLERLKEVGNKSVKIA